MFQSQNKILNKIFFPTFAIFCASLLLVSYSNKTLAEELKTVKSIGSKNNYSNGFDLTSSTVADIAEDVAASVVSLEISVKGKRAVPTISDSFDFGRGKIYQVVPQISQVEAKVGDGSGFIISSDGYIVTNQHVINPNINGRKVPASKVEVVMYDGRRYVAQIIGQDEDSDIAVIKVNASGLRPIEWGDTSLIRAGEFALTIGSSLGADHTVGFGIISAVSRKKPQVSREAFFGDLEYIQTYAQINPGNSGGPLINLKGEVIGITSFIELAPHSPGFAIPANYARKVVSSLIKDGIVKRPAVGIYIVNLNSNNLIGNSDNLDQNQSGVLVRDVLKGGPANQAGIEIGDLITKVNGQDIKLPQEFTHSIRTSPVGSVFNLEILRGKQKINTNLKSAYLD